jgi:hypothetical protein
MSFYGCLKPRIDSREDWGLNRGLMSSGRAALGLPSPATQIASLGVGGPTPGNAPPLAESRYPPTGRFYCPANLERLSDLAVLAKT